MSTTSRSSQGRSEATPVRFAAMAFDEQMRQRGVIGEQAKADALGVHRATLYRWRAGRDLWLSLADAFHYAKRVKIPVEDLFVPVTPQRQRSVKAAA